MRPVVGLVVVLLATTCSADDDTAKGPSGGDGVSSATAGASSSSDRQGGEGVGPVDPDGTADGSRSGVEPTTSADPPPTTRAASAPPDGPVGSFGVAYLRPDGSERIVVELLAQGGASLRSRTIEHATDTLARVTAKPVEVRDGAAVTESRMRWSSDDIRAVSSRLGRVRAEGGVAPLRLVLLRGEFSGPGGAEVLGVAVRGDTMAIFVDRVEAAGGLLVGASAIERAATLHEIGHLLGLVDLVLETGRGDPDHPNHSRNEDSVMFWAVESALVASLLGGGPPDEFDSDDEADLRAIARS